MSKKILVYIYFLCINLTFVLKITSGNTLPGIAMIILLPLLLIDYRKIPKCFVWLLCFYVLLLPINTYGASNIIFYIIGSLALYNIDFKTVLKANLMSQTIFFIIMFALNIVGMVTDKLVPKGIGFAHDYGFGNPNTVSIFLSYYLLTIYMLYVDTHKFAVFLLSICIGLATLITQSRSLLVATGLIDLALICPKGIVKRIITSKAVIVTLIAFIPFSVWFILQANDLADMNDVTSGRIHYIMLMLDEFTPLNLITGLEPPEDAIIDNVYMLLVTYGGIVILCYLLFRFYITMTRRIYALKYLCVIGVAFVVGYVESYYINPFISGTFLIWGLLLGNKTIMRNEHRSSLCDIRA